MSLAACAAAYTLTGALVSETATYPTASINGYGTTTTVLNTYTTSYSSSTTPGTVIYTTPHLNVTYSTLTTTTTSSPPSQFTGGASHLGFPAFALVAAGAVMVL
jgi:hypothetical protein